MHRTPCQNENRTENDDQITHELPSTSTKYDENNKKMLRNQKITSYMHSPLDPDVAQACLSV
jgi:hypothetical protein